MAFEQDLEEFTNGFFEALYFAEIDEGDFVEVWVTSYRRPFSIYSIYERKT